MTWIAWSLYVGASDPPIWIQVNEGTPDEMQAYVDKSNHSLKVHMVDGEYRALPKGVSPSGESTTSTDPNPAA